MRVRWSPEAYEDLACIHRHIREDDASAAARVVTAIYNGASALTTFPNRGRKGRVEGTRELPLPPLPFIVVYRILQNFVEIVNILHGAQRWPKA
jgi:addiction module RelE/StbE family toxin